MNGSNSFFNNPYTKGGINEKADTLQEILPQKTDSARLADNERVSRGDEGRGLVGNWQTPRSSSRGSEDTPTLAYLIIT
jgi:hypothetical protein